MLGLQRDVAQHKNTKTSRSSYACVVIVSSEDMLAQE